jgi:hypothetical protein
MNYQPLLLPDHVHIIYPLYPHPKVIEHAKNPTNQDPEDCCACERLIKKLVMPTDDVGRDEREPLEAKLVEKILSELGDFKNCVGHFASSH